MIGMIEIVRSLSGDLQAAKSLSRSLDLCSYYMEVRTAISSRRFLQRRRTSMACRAAEVVLFCRKSNTTSSSTFTTRGLPSYRDNLELLLLPGR